VEIAWLVMGRDGRYIGAAISLIRAKTTQLYYLFAFYKVVLVVSKQKEIIHQSDVNITKAQKMLDPTHMRATQYRA